MLITLQPITYCTSLGNDDMLLQHQIDETTKCRNQVVYTADILANVLIYKVSHAGVHLSHAYPTTHP